MFIVIIYFPIFDVIKFEINLSDNLFEEKVKQIQIGGYSGPNQSQLEERHSIRLIEAAHIMGEDFTITTTLGLFSRFREYKIANTENGKSVYNVKICYKASCSCPDFIKNAKITFCRHVFFMLYFLYFLLSKIFGSSHWRCSVKKGVLENLINFIRKHLCRSIFLIQLQA